MNLKNIKPLALSILFTGCVSITLPSVAAPANDIPVASEQSKAQDKNNDAYRVPGSRPSQEDGSSLVGLDAQTIHLLQIWGSLNVADKNTVLFLLEQLMTDATSAGDGRMMSREML